LPEPIEQLEGESDEDFGKRFLARLRSLGS
jgi:hypothetical protein